MSGPWDDFAPASQASPAAPWADFAPQGNAANWGPTTEIMNGATLGQLPKIEGWMGSKINPALSAVGWPNIPPTGQLQADRDAYAQAHPYIGGAANLAGASLPFLATEGALGGAGLGARVAGMGATGAATGGATAALNGQDPTMPALVGAGAGSAGELGATALSSGAGRVASALLNKGVKVPSSADLRATAAPQYTALQSSPAALSLAEGKQAGQDIIDQLNHKWLGDTTAAKEFGALITPPPNATSVTAGGLEGARQNLNAILKQQPGTPNAAAAAMGKQAIDRLVAAKASADPNWAQFETDAQAARGNWQAAKGSDTITGAMDKGIGRAATNLVDNSPQLISKRAQSLLENPRLTQGLPQDALDQVGDVAHPSPFRKVLSTLSSGTGHTGVGLSTAIPLAIIEAATHGGVSPETLAVLGGGAVVGSGASAINRALTKSGMNSAAETVRMNSPAFKDAVASGASDAPIDVGSTVDQARRLASALAAAGAQRAYSP